MERTHWEEDNDKTECSRCGAAFSTFKRKHHCRSCGRIFCGACSNHKMIVSFRGFEHPVRVCIQCREIIETAQSLQDSSAPLSVSDKTQVARRLCDLSEDTIACHTIHRAGTTPSLINVLLKCPEVHCKSAASLTLARLAQYSTYRTVISAHPSAVALLIELLGLTDSAGQYGAAMALNQLAIDEHSRLEIGYADAVPVLLARLPSPDVQVQYAALSALATLSLSIDNRNILRECGGVESVVHATLAGANNGQDPIAAAGCAVLATLCQSEENLDAVASAGGLEAFFVVARSRDLLLRRVAVNGLGNLCRHRDVKSELASTPSLLAVVAYLAESGDDTYIQSQALATVCVLAEDGACRAALRQLSFVLTLLNVIEQEEEQALRAGATLALTALASDPAVKEEITAEGLAAVINLVRDGDPATQTYAAALMSSLAESDTCRARVGQAGALQPLFDLCLGSRHARGLTARALGYLSLNITNSIRMVEFGVLPPLVAMTTNDLFAVQFLSSWTLANLAVNATSPTNKARLREREVLTHIDATVRRWSLLVGSDGALSHSLVGITTSTFAPSSLLIGDVSVLGVLVDADCIEVQAWAAWAMAMLSFGPASKGQLARQAEGLVCKLGRIFSLGVQRGLAVLLCNIVSDETLDTREKVSFLTPEVVDVVDSLTQSSYSEVQNIAKRTQARVSSLV